jgi:hypothetical protein
LISSSILALQTFQYFLLYSNFSQYRAEQFEEVEWDEGLEIKIWIFGDR